MAWGVGLREHDVVAVPHRLVIGEQRGDVPIGPDAEEGEIELRIRGALGCRGREFGGVGIGRIRDRRVLPDGREGLDPLGGKAEESSNARRDWVSLRSGSPLGRYRSSPHQKVTRDQSTLSRLLSPPTAASTASPIEPPVSTTCASGFSARVSRIRLMNRAATAEARLALSS
ncbi:hypothetical protein GCM10025869_31080 [Homoserinibacter gongjuensis]|uniref:Uncharacterized protein n=1 Tax=Homoserinibacter gongjuensis TaxID=1162968 RepID=A0ABQ6JX47_9MICO|nr:hypothetical protein GCM10025869_31080 [Homoserinibacter gongjuensis]